MVKKKKKILPPQLPHEIPDEEIEACHADHKDEELEALYEKRRRKAALKKAKEEEGLQVDRVDALPIKTFYGKLVYRTTD